MNTAADAILITPFNKKPLASPFHQNIVKGKLMNKICQAGDRIIIYDVQATEPEGIVRVTRATQFKFE